MKKKYILSIDGGGVRTIASIIFLQKLEANLQIPLSEKFDFFIGTSAGAISSLGLSINKMSASDLMNIWSKENLVKTMTNSSWETSLGIMQINPKYTNEGKREVLKEFPRGGLVRTFDEAMARAKKISFKVHKTTHALGYCIISSSCFLTAALQLG